MSDTVKTDGSGARYKRELTGMYRTAREAARAKRKLMWANPSLKCRVDYLPMLRKWTVVG